LVIATNVTVEGHVGGGAGSPGITLDGGNAVTVLDIAAGVTAALDGLAIVNGFGKSGTAGGGYVGLTGGSAAGGHRRFRRSIPSRHPLRERHGGGWKRRARQ